MCASYLRLAGMLNKHTPFLDQREDKTNCLMVLQTSLWARDLKITTKLQTKKRDNSSTKYVATVRRKIKYNEQSK